MATKSQDWALAPSSKPSGDRERALPAHLRLAALTVGLAFLCDGITESPPFHAPLFLELCPAGVSCEPKTDLSLTAADAFLRSLSTTEARRVEELAEAAHAAEEARRNPFLEDLVGGSSEESTIEVLEAYGPPAKVARVLTWETFKDGILTGRVVRECTAPSRCIALRDGSRVAGRAHKMLVALWPLRYAIVARFHSNQALTRAVSASRQHSRHRSSELALVLAHETPPSGSAISVVEALVGSAVRADRRSPFVADFEVWFIPALSAVTNPAKFRRAVAPFVREAEAVDYGE